MLGTASGEEEWAVLTQSLGIQSWQRPENGPRSEREQGMGQWRKVSMGPQKQEETVEIFKGHDIHTYTDVFKEPRKPNPLRHPC